MDTDDDVSTFEEEEASLSESDNSQIDGLQSIAGNEEGSSKEGFNFNPALLINSGQDEEEQIKFQVMCAHTEVSDADKFVVYTIDIERGDDSRPALLERRYSDFLSLYSALRQSHPGLLNQIRFPRKVLMGNFKVDVIEERSSFFENFLSYIYSKDVLKCSEPFNTFIYRRELQESSHHLLHSEFESAIPILENLYWLSHKLRGDRDQLLRVLLHLIVCLHAVGNYELSYDYSLLALPRFESRLIDGNSLAKELYIPFLQFCLRLWWVLGRNRSIFEAKLKKAKEEGARTEGLADLLEILRDEISLPSLHT